MTTPQKRGRGRPISKAPARGTHTMAIDVTPAQRRDVQRLAAADGRSVRNWLSRAIDRAIIQQEADAARAVR